MKGTPGIYLGKIIDKNKFRTFIFGPNGEKKIVESWEAYEAAMQSGIWFATKKDAEASKAILESEVDEKPKAKPRSRAKPKPVKVEEVEADSEIAPDELDDMVFEVNDNA